MNRFHTEESLAKFAEEFDLHHLPFQKHEHKTMHPYNSELTPGTVICLDAPTKRYVLVIKEWTTDTHLVIPFSPYSIPALRGEFYIGFDEDVSNLGYKVAECWNARTVLNTILEKGWKVGTVSDKVLNSAFSLFRHMMIDAPIDKDLQDVVGAPLKDEKDIRYKYQTEELKAFRDIVIHIGAKLHEKLVADKETDDAERLADFLDMM